MKIRPKEPRRQLSNMLLYVWLLIVFIIDNHCVNAEFRCSNDDIRYGDEYCNKVTQEEQYPGSSFLKSTGMTLTCESGWRWNTGEDRCSIPCTSDDFCHDFFRELNRCNDDDEGCYNYWNCGISGKCEMNGAQDPDNGGCYHDLSPYTCSKHSDCCGERCATSGKCLRYEALTCAEDLDCPVILNEMNERSKPSYQSSGGDPDDDKRRRRRRSLVEVGKFENYLSGSATYNAIGKSYQCQNVYNISLYMLNWSHKLHLQYNLQVCYLGRTYPHIHCSHK